MKRNAVKDVAASVHQRLLNLAQKTNRPFNELLQYFAMERFLYRLCRSPHGQRFVLKGALMLRAWRAPLSRPTKDIDLLGRVHNDVDVDAIVGVFRDVCGQEVEADALVFAPTSVRGQRIVEDADYEGVRIRLKGSMGKARITMQVDVGFGDVVVPAPETTLYPTLLDHPAPRLLGYSRESAIAEKFEALVKLGLVNSRMKDFYDLWLLSRQFPFDGQLLSTAIVKTFRKRGTEIPARPVALTAAFSGDSSKRTQWRGFIRKNRLEDLSKDLPEIIEAIEVFLGPPARALSQGTAFSGTWKPPGPWTT